MAERWNGTKWTITPTPDADNRGAMSAVSCASAGACTAVGMLDSRGLGRGAERWNGSKWSIQRTANVNGGILRDVSCPSRATCVSVGVDSVGTTSGTLAERWTR
jgi:hypothetical protein